jgi:hypothetical protein
VRQVKVEPLARHASTSTVTVTATGDAPEALKADLRDAFARELEARSGLEVSESAGKDAFRAELQVISAEVPEQRVEPTGRLQSYAHGMAGRFGMGRAGAGRLTFEAVLHAPRSDEPVGFLRYDRHGDAVALLEDAGKAAGLRLGREIAYQRDRFVRRRAGDERLMFTPTPLTLEKGEWFISDDELLLVRAGVGVHRRVQLDVWLGGLPLYGAIGTGAGAALFGVIDLGVKVAVLEEGVKVPGLSLSYDFLTVFGVGGGGMLLQGGGVVAASGGNAQFNLFALSMSKHFANTQVVLGTYLLDNHHFVPQGAAFASQEGASSHEFARVPFQVQPFVALEQVLGPHTSLAGELFPRLSLAGTRGSLGIRWLLGGSSPKGPLAVERVRVRLDLAALVIKFPRTSPLMVPWLGIGLHVARKP